MDVIHGRLHFQFKAEIMTLIRKVSLCLILKIPYVVGGDSCVGDINMASPAGIYDAIFFKQGTPKRMFSDAV